MTQAVKTNGKTHDPAAMRGRRESLEISRTALAELTGLPVSRIWACEQDDKDVSEEHLTIVRAALDNVEKNGLPDHLRPKQRPAGSTRTPTARLKQVAALLDEALRAKTAKEMKAVIEQAQAVIVGESMQVTQTETGDVSPA